MKKLCSLIILFVGFACFNSNAATILFAGGGITGATDVDVGVPQEQVFKTLVVALDGKELAVGVIPVSSMLSMKLAAGVSK